jgi:hypothetical protein
VSRVPSLSRSGSRERGRDVAASGAHPPQPFSRGNSVRLRNKMEARGFRVPFTRQGQPRPWDRKGALRGPRPPLAAPRRPSPPLAAAAAPRPRTREINIDRSGGLCVRARHFYSAALIRSYDRGSVGPSLCALCIGARVGVDRLLLIYDQIRGSRLSGLFFFFFFFFFIDGQSR